MLEPVYLPTLKNCWQSDNSSESGTLPQCRMNLTYNQYVDVRTHSTSDSGCRSLLTGACKSCLSKKDSNDTFSILCIFHNLDVVYLYLHLSLPCLHIHDSIKYLKLQFAFLVD